MCLDNSLLKALQDTAARLEEHMKIYNPVINPDSNGIQEANLTMQFAHQCLLRNWFVYPETSNVKVGVGAQGPIRVDLHVICEGQFILTVESKKFYSSGQCKGIILDYKRAKSLKYDHKYSNLPHYVLLLAVTEAPDYANWWCQSEQWDNKTQVWKDLAEILQSDGMVTSSFPMHDNEKTHHFLYAISEVR